MTGSLAENSRIEGASSQAPLFVINLCASTSPMALSHPNSPELKRYTFFVSRQREDGRERFRLHMGYFASQEEAEALLSAIRDVYPAAWAGPAPAGGAGRRGRAATVPAPAPAPALAQVQAAAPLKNVEPPKVVESPTPVAAEPAPVGQPPKEIQLDDMSNVRRVLASLDDTVPFDDTVPKELTAAQALRVLEAPVADASEGLAVEVEDAPDVRLVTPEDTQTLRDIKLDAENNAPPCFAVQLVWSVSPVDVSTLPHLAIFDAYTLYNVEGKRQGRKWYGLRLGFFSDPHSATQVANYVRSDYRSVAIVPVAIRERDNARGATTAPAKAAPAPRLGEPAAPLKPQSELGIDRENLDGFELLADDRPAPLKRDLDDSQPVKQPNGSVPQPPTLKPAPARPNATGKSAKPTGKRVVVRKRPDATLARTAPGAATPLESTLEILGASTLTLDESREILNDSAVRRPVDKKPAAGNRFSKLLSRLGGG